MKNLMNDNITIPAVGGGQTKILSAVGFHSGEQVENFPGGITPLCRISMILKLINISFNSFNRKWSVKSKWIYNFGARMTVQQNSMPPPETILVT